MFEFPERPTAMVSSHVSHDGNYLIITISEGSDGKILMNYADLSIKENKDLSKKLEVKPIVSEWIATYDYVHNIGKTFYIQTDYKAPLNKIVKFDIEKPAFENWVDVVPESENKVLQSVSSMKNGTVMLITYLENASEKVKIYDF